MDAQTRLNRKKELRTRNINAWNNKPDLTLYKNLDSNIKKNTAFIKKCKTMLTADSSAQLLKDIRSLKLEKYISEVVTALMEGLIKCKGSSDIYAAVEVISNLHQRFPESFTPQFTDLLMRALSPANKQHLAALSSEQREKEENARITKQRIFIRITGELWLVGFFWGIDEGLASGKQVKESIAGLMTANQETILIGKEMKHTGNVLHSILKDLFSVDKDNHMNLPLAVAFVKYFGRDLLGIVPKKEQQSHGDDSEGTEVPRDAANTVPFEETLVGVDVSSEQQELFKNLFIDYYRSVEKQLIKAHKYIKKMEKSNHESHIARGELSDESKQNYEKASKVYERILFNTQSLADGLDCDLPDLPEDEGTTKITESMIKEGVSANSDDKENTGNGIWSDEDARLFYESLIDLKLVVPGILLDVKKKKEDEKSEKPTVEEHTDLIEGEAGSDAPMSVDESKAEISSDVVEDDGMALERGAEENATENSLSEDKSELKSTTSAQIETLLTRLPNMINRDLIDQAAVDFCYLNSKAARKRLIQALVGVARARLDLLPYYSRLIATLNPYFPDIGQGVVTALEHEFKTLKFRKGQDLLETRIKNIRFIGELTKFKITPLYLTFHCLKVLLDDFALSHIEVACNLLETCGRFLFKSPETAIRTSNMLEIMMRKKNALHLDNRQVLMIENAYYQCNPPDRDATIRKVHTPMELYVRKLIYSDLSKKTVDKVLRLLRKLHWSDPEVYRIVKKIFHKVWKVKFGNVHLLAMLASGLHRYHSDFGVFLVDQILEDIRIGLEQNIFKHNQRRITTVKYLAELYNYRLIDSPVVFDTLYSILTLGHENGRPSPSRFTPIDAPDDFFRVRLCCTLLDTCGMCFDRGRSKSRLDSFLIFFQMYIWSKIPMPMDVEFMVNDTFEALRPNMKLFDSYEEAALAVDEMLLVNAKVLQDAGAEKSQDDNGDESELSDTSSGSDIDEEIDDKEADDF
ncbi:mRNA decay protein [Basidiobolus ranarum]|uniref:mRNA decay protein n=1 Tax=Basidiobolus ranarum TaxID=34480 RepID=A0ABR2X316_9FUNG